MATIMFALVASGCTQVVTGAGAAGRDSNAASPTPEASPPAAPAGPRSTLEVDPIDDECLLNASEFGALVGSAVRPPAQSTVSRGDGSAGSSCVAVTDGEPVAMINVYRPDSGTPAEYVRAGGTEGREEISGVGEAAVVIGTETGPTLQLAGESFLVTILVSGSTPDEDAWRDAATAALSRLPG